MACIEHVCRSIDNEVLVLRRLVTRTIVLYLYLSNLPCRVELLFLAIYSTCQGRSLCWRLV